VALMVRDARRRAPRHEGQHLVPAASDLILKVGPESGE
jgi:hypothetical protein